MKKEIILKIDNLCKSFGEVKAVNNISFEVRKGELFAFLGTNGAGKSTTIKILTTLLKQDSGTFLLNNKNNDNYIRSKIGVVFQENVLDNFLTVKENLLYTGALFLKNKELVLKKYEELKTLLEFKECENKQYRYLSGGQKRRIEIARALLGEPEILFLDEPTTGLDPESRKLVWNIIKKLQKEKNITVFLTTHYMEESNDADYVVIIDKGVIKAKGSPIELKNVFAKDVLKIKPFNENLFVNYLNEQNIPYYKVADMIILTNNTTLNTIALLNENKNNIESFEHIKGTMDDVFLTALKGNEV